MSHAINKASHATIVDDDKISFGFWVYLMTDCVLFATLFATYAVLHRNTNGGESGHELFSLPFVLIETLILLTSSFVCGLAILSARRKQMTATLTLLGITFALGVAFVGMELHEFSNLYNEGNGWQHSAFLSSFFTLVATHGLHITIGLIWLSIMMIRATQIGLTTSVLRKLGLFSLFWHFLDIVWIFIFTIVYLFGAAKL